jgi:hypothetical protein
VRRFHDGSNEAERSPRTAFRAFAVIGREIGPESSSAIARTTPVGLWRLARPRRHLDPLARGVGARRARSRRTTSQPCSERATKGVPAAPNPPCFSMVSHGWNQRDSGRQRNVARGLVRARPQWRPGTGMSAAGIRCSGGRVVSPVDAAFASGPGSGTPRKSSIPITIRMRKLKIPT